MPKAAGTTREGEEQQREGTDGSDQVYLLTHVHDELVGESLLSIVDGVELEQVALLRLPARVPYGIHGHWMPEDELREHIAHHSARRAADGYL